MRRTIVLLLAVALSAPSYAGWDKTKPATSSPPVSAEIRDNWAALELAVGAQNLLADPTFLIWPAGDAAAPAHWTVAGTFATIARAGTGLGDTSRKVGKYTAKMTSGSATMTLEQNLLTTTSYDDGFDGRTITGCAWDRASNASTARVYIADGAGTTFSSFHTGGGAYEWLCATRVVDAAATKITFGAECAATTRVCYVSGATVVLGGIPPTDFMPPTVVYDQITCFIAGNQTVTANKVGANCIPSRPRPFLVQEIALRLQTTAPTGADLIVDVNHWDGAAFTSMFTAGGRPKIVAGAVSGSAVPDGTYRYRCFTAATGSGRTDAEANVDVDQIGSGAPGTDLHVGIRIMEFARPLDAFLGATELN